MRLRQPNMPRPRSRSSMSVPAEMPAHVAHVVAVAESEAFELAGADVDPDHLTRAVEDRRTAGVGRKLVRRRKAEDERAVRALDRDRWREPVTRSAVHRQKNLLAERRSRGRKAAMSLSE